MDNDVTQGVGEDGVDTRSAYRAPRLVDHGSVHQLILGQGGSGLDGMSGMSMIL